MKLPNIDWECRLQVSRPDGTTNVICTTVSAETTHAAYAICKKMADNAGYTITGSSIWPKNGRRSEVQHTRDDPPPPWSRAPYVYNVEDDEDDVEAEDIFDLKFFSKTTARPTIKQWKGDFSDPPTA